MIKVKSTKQVQYYNYHKASSMIKSIIQKIMIKQFSKYIKGIEYNKLTIEVLGGYFSIENISLNHQFFNNLETPLNITYSHIGKLSIEAPLTKLSSVPVSCTIEDVYVIAEHKKNCHKVSEISKEELLTKYIKETFEAFSDKIKDANKEEGMFDKLGKKVVDNLKMQIKNIHIRFQEANKDHTYSFGLSLKSLTFGTTDKNWKPIFIEREKGKEDEPVFKCMNIQNFKLYWQSIRPEQAKEFLFLKLPNDSLRIEGMKKFVTNDADSIFNISSTVKLKINPVSYTTLPLFQLAVELQPININFSKQKMVETLDFTTSCIKYNEIMLKSLLDKALKKLTHDQENKYKPICGKFVDTALQKEKKKLSNIQGQEYKDLFDHIAIEHLYELAMPFIKVKVQEQREKQLKKQKKSWFSSAQVQLTPQEKKEVEKLLNELAEDSIAKGRPPQSSLLKLMLSLKGLSIMFYDENIENRLKTIELTIGNVACVLEKSHSTSYFSIESRVERITADLTLLQNGKEQKIHLMENICGQKDEYLIELIYRESVKVGKKTVINYFSDLSLRKTLFTYKKQYWKMFNSFFALPTIDQQVQNQAMGKLELLKKQSSDSQGEDIQIEKYYNVNLNLSSPTFILPLSPTTYWYLDLGKITMKSETLPNKFSYPFRLSQLNMRYISQAKKIDRAESLLNSKEFFPIIQNINVEVNVLTTIGSNTIEFEILLNKIQLNATKEEFANLIKVKKFLVGEEKDQLEEHKEQLRLKEELVKGKRVDGKVLTRNKYFSNWIEFYCILSNNNLHFYSSEKDLVPENIVSLRGFKTRKPEGEQHILELLSSGQSFYLQLSDGKSLEQWQAEIFKNLHELKDFHSLILEGGDVKPKEKRKKKQDLMNVSLKLNEMSWNYLNEKGQTFLKIQLSKIVFKATEKEEAVETSFNIGKIQIIDRLFEYNNQRYQSLFLASKLGLTISKTKQAATKTSPTIVSLAVADLDVNWKPDVLLLIIQSIKQFLNIKQLVVSKNSRKQTIQEVQNDNHFNAKQEMYAKSASKDSVKARREDYLRMNEKDDQIYLKMTVIVASLSVRFIHRQSHMPMFWLKSQQLKTTYSTGRVQRYVEGVIGSLELFDITGYPQKEYDIGAEYKPYCLLRKKQEIGGQPFGQFRYSQYQPQQIANCERVDSFLSVNFAPISLSYLQEVSMRLIDYFLIQIVMLLSHPQAVTVNQNVLKQLNSNSPRSQKPRNFLQSQFQQVLKRFFSPFFMDYLFTFESPDIILSPTKNSDNFFTLAIKTLSIANRPIKNRQRFQNARFQFPDKVYEEQIDIKGSEIIFNTVRSGKVSRLAKDPFDLSMIVNRLILQDQMNEISPDIAGYDRSFKIDNNISAIRLTELSRDVYQDLIRLPNFNLNFQDECNQIFIHNYKITKILAPKQIRYKLNIEEVSAVAKYTIQEVSIPLWSIAFHGFQLQMNRDEKLNSLVEITFDKATASTYQYPDLKNLLQWKEKPLAFISNPKNTGRSYVLIKLPNTGIIDIQACMQSCELALSLGVMPLIADWVQPEDSVFAVSKRQNKLIKFLVRLPRVEVTLEEEGMFGQSLKMIGELVIDVTRRNGQTQNYLRQAYASKTVLPDYIEQLNNFLAVRVTVGIQFFSYFQEYKRKMLEKTKIELKEEYFYRIRNDKFRKTVRRRLVISQLKGSISVDDVILFKSVVQCSSQGDTYGKAFKERLRQVQSQHELEKGGNQQIQNEKILEEFVFNLGLVKFYLIHKEGKEFLPILRLSANRISLLEFVNHQNQVYNGQLEFEASYFNNLIFRWEPLVENTKAKATMTSNIEKHQFLEVEISNQIYINVSSEMAVSVRKALRAVEERIEQFIKGSYMPEKALEYQSRYVIANLTGYPFQIFDNTHKSQYFLMHEERINYFTPQLRDNFFQENQVRQTFSFLLHHPKQELLQVTSLSLQSQKSFQILLYDAKGKKLPEHCGLLVYNRIEGCKKVLTIRSKKYVSDYSGNILVKKYYPFDIDQSITFNEGTHKGVKANFFSNTKTERFNYSGVSGNLVIRKNYLVYNYTVIPLQVCQNIVVPGQFVGINEQLTIQGEPYRESFLKVVKNEARQEYYIYCICYIIDYTGLSFVFDQQYSIKQLYSYAFKQNGKDVRIYLLPDIAFEFAVKMGKSNSRKLNGKLARETFEITTDNSINSYACYSRLQSFCQNNIKEFKKIIEITNAYQICNDTTETLVVRQVGSIDKEKIVLKQGENAVFNWCNKFLKELMQISINQEEWGLSAPLSIGQSIDTFIIRNKKRPQMFRIYSLQLEETNNLTFIHILNADKKYEICNELTGVNIRIYQSAIFQNQESLLSKDVEPSNYYYQLPPKTTKYFGFQLPLQSHQLAVHFQSTTNKQDFQLSTIDNIEKSVIEKSLQIFKSKQKINIKLQFNRDNRRLRFYVKRREIFKKEKDEELQAKLKIKGICLGLIGTHNEVRKEIINASFSTISFQLLLNKQFSEISFQLQQICIENTLKPEPYFISLFRQEEEQNLPALKFALKRSRFNPNLIYYVGFSMRRSTITVTSEQLQLLQENINHIMEQVNAKSDTNFLIDYEDKFQPSRICNKSKLYFVEAELHPLKFILTYKHVNNWGGALLKALSINNCKVKVNGKKISNFDSRDLLDFFAIMGKYFKEEFENQIFSMIGSLALLGSPLNLASKIGCGLQNLIELPADGFEDNGVLGIGTGLALGTGSLISNTVEGAFGSVESITGAIGEGISGLASYDKKFEQTRQELKNQRVDHVGQGLLSGGKSIFNGLFTGITGLVTEPIKGAQKEGLGGFFKGGFKGLTGLIVKPVSGVIDATSKTAEGIKNTTKVFSKETRDSKVRKYNPRPFYGYYREIRPYDPVLAQWNKQIGLYSARYSCLSWSNIYPMKGGEMVILSYEYLLVLSKKQLDVTASFESSSILSINSALQKITIIAKNTQEEKEKLQLEPKEFAKFNGQLIKVFNYYNKNYELAVDRKSTPK